MAIYKNSVPYGNIVTNRLTLNIDATNPACYPGTGTTAFDQSPVRTNCTLSRSGSFAARAATHFDQTVTIPSVTTTRGLGQSGTIDFWFQNKVSRLSNTVLFGDYSTSLYFYQHSTMSTNQYSIISYYNAGFVGSSPGVIYTPNVWYNMVVSLSNTGQYGIYRNGVAFASGTASSFTSWNGFSTSYTIGNALGANNMGTANMRMYNRFLTAAEVTQNYNALKSRFGY